jgi:hypothetical protein
LIGLTIQVKTSVTSIPYVGVATSVGTLRHYQQRAVYIILRRTGITLCAEKQNFCLIMKSAAPIKNKI